MEGPGCIIHLNRRGINEIEVPERVQAVRGEPLIVRIINHGSSIHITLSAENAGDYTHFYHTNLYIKETTDYAIPIGRGAPTGEFNLTLIAGYGSRKTGITVEVIEPEEQPSTVIPEEEEPSDKAPSILPAIIFLLLLLATAGLYAGWILSGRDILNYGAFGALLAALVLIWYCRR